MRGIEYWLYVIAETGDAAAAYGIEQARREGKYRGRKPLHVDTPRLCEVYENYKSGRLTAEKAAQAPGMSGATFFRKIKELK